MKKISDVLDSITNTVLRRLVIVLLIALLIIVLILLNGCTSKEEKPFLIIKKDLFYMKADSIMYCRYRYVDNDGRKRWTYDKADRYSIGTIIH